MSNNSLHPQRDSTVLQRLAEVVNVPAEHQHVTSASSACPSAPPPPSWSAPVISCQDRSSAENWPLRRTLRAQGSAAGGTRGGRSMQGCPSRTGSDRAANESAAAGSSSASGRSMWRRSTSLATSRTGCRTTWTRRTAGVPTPAGCALLFELIIAQALSAVKQHCCTRDVSSSYPATTCHPLDHGKAHQLSDAALESAARILPLRMLHVRQTDSGRDYLVQEHQLSLQTSWPGPGGAQLSGSASHSSAGGGGGVSVTGSAPLDAQRHSTLFAAAQAYTDEPPSVEVELDDRRAPACAVGDRV